ncbi:MAG: AbrB family transcriptional regulator [Aeromicrobium erythreum]
MRAWLRLGAFVAVASVVLVVAQVPSALLFGGLVGALLFALRTSQPLEAPRWLSLVGQGVVGAIVGASVDWGTFADLGWSWPVVLAVSALTIAVSVAAGQLLRLHAGVTPVTASFASIAGGASGMTALSRDLGADDRVVTVIQYLRVLIVLFSMPAVVALVFHEHGSGAAEDFVAGDWRDVAFCAVAVGSGLLLGRLAHLPSPAILGPVVTAAALHAVPGLGDAVVPTWVAGFGYLAIGVQVGLRFTLDSLRSIARMLPTAFVSILLTLVTCAGLGLALSAVTGVSRLDAYLATTPGGLYAVLATSTATGGNVTFVTAVQLLRLLVVLLLAPALARMMRRP